MDISDKIEFANKSESLRESPNQLLFKNVRKLRMLLYVHRANYISLCQYFDRFESKVESSEFWSNASPFLRWNIQKGITTHLFNYLNSASAIADISRRYKNEHLLKESKVAYEEHIDVTFNQNNDFRFLRDLRNYVSHFGLLDIGVNFNWHYKEGKRKVIYLSKDRLKEWADWKSGPKEFLKNAEEKIHLEPLIHEYHEEFMATQDYLFLEIIKRHKKEFSNLILEMDSFIEEGRRVEMLHSLPFRVSTLRYLKCILRKIDL